jgi:DNA-binding response OmpR family regulator
MSRVLVIDDSPLVSQLLKDGLTEHGFEVAVAMNANEGYATAVEFHPDLILLDVQLPDVTGFDLLRVFKNHEVVKNIPIIMITGTHHQTEYKVKGFQMGIDDFVMKPFEIAELVERVKAVIRRRGSVRPVEMPAAVLPSQAAPKSDTVKTKEAAALAQTVLQILLFPEKMSASIQIPGSAMAFLLAMLGLSLGGVLFASGAAPKPAIVIVAVVGLWGMLIAVLVMSSSLMGIALTWKDGARLLALAGLPMILKMAAALLITIATTLSPFYFTAGPALFFSAAPWWLERIDLFEFWSAGLAWWMISRLPKSSRAKAWMITALLWGSAFLISALLARVGGKP